ncbi:Extracellular matrix-binding ebh, putative [Babesia ovata]|uniref:Extracellular matrix-binding ebh, putative n=1 Tax=Babesia ovata TaxID=189622 RepID=A0A2H6K984_9APIC|nr:Extracellular matrix-binding ebh, putative [Babesia ovata]GBE59553.1 Extracellular matrix-binding ebh, putative [Babesia ovata]
MAPKALTDCPENLREAIDWLIQVKHGGGIQTLAEALGYKPPGTYDGSGIVYGSASRLCDAVVSFLHRVISDVRDNQPYVVGRVLLGGLISELEKARWSGHHGFKAVLPKVASGLGEYNRKVKDSNDRVKRPISELLDHVNPDGELLKRVNGLQVESVTEEEVKKAERLVEECRKRADAFYNDMNKVASTTSAIKDLNPTLRDRVMSAKKHMAQERKRLRNLTRKERDNVEAITKIISKALRELENSVSNKISEQIDALVEKLKGMVEKIRAKLVDIYLELGKYVDELEAWITEAKKFIEFAEQNVKKILDEVTVKESGAKPERWKKIEENVNNINNGLDMQIKALQAWINNAEETRGKAEKRAKEAFDILSYYKDYKTREKTELAENIQKILDAKEQIVKVHEGLKDADKDLETWKNAAGGLLGNVIGATKGVKDKLTPAEKNPEHEIAKKFNEITKAKNNIEKANKTLSNHLGSLKEWKQEVSTVLQEAINRATDVHDALRDTDITNPLGKEINNIEERNKEIQDANDLLGKEVHNLGNWKSAAGKVIGKVNEKCGAILGKVHHNSGVLKTEIGENANKLKEKAENLLTAYQAAHQNVSQLEQQVKAAVSQLEEGMKMDLVDLQQSIVGEMKGHVGEMIKQIQGQVTKIKGEAGTGNGTGGKGLEGIASGLVGSYASGFTTFGRIVNGWAEGMLGNNEKGDKEKKVKEWLQKYVDEKGGSGIDVVRLLNGSIRRFSWSRQIIKQIREQLQHEIDNEAQGHVISGMEKANGKVEATVQAVKKACETFVKGIDQKLKDPGFKQLAENIYQGILSEGGWKSYGSHLDNKKAIEPATEAALIGLSATASQVAGEIQSILLDKRVGNYDPGNSKSIAEELDSVVEETKALHGNLGAAHQQTVDGIPPLPVAQGTNNDLAKQVDKIKEKVNQHIPEQAQMANQFSTVMQKYHEAKGETGRGGHKYHELTTKLIPGAMQPFKTEAKLTDPGQVAGQKGEVQEYFNKIMHELQAVAHLVDKDKQAWPPALSDQEPSDKDGIRQRLENLTKMLKNVDKYDIKYMSFIDGLNVISVKGLEKIREDIETLQLVAFTNQPIEIHTAVQEIKDQLEKLRDDLKATSGKKDDVINRLNDLKNNGLGDQANSWNGRNGLMKIHENIETLQLVAFTNEPIEIQHAVTAMTQELQELQKDLDNNVTNKLQTLQKFGLENGGYDWYGNHNAKGFETIKEGIEKHNKTLKTQNDIINSSMQVVRRQLALVGVKLQHAVSDDDVLDPLRLLRKMIGKDTPFDGNLQAIHKALDGVHTLVPRVNAQLTELCEAVKIPGLSVKEALERLSTLIEYDYVVINGGEQHGLNETKNELKRLRAYLLSGPIEACEQFLRDADAAGRLAKQRIRGHLHQQIQLAEDAMIAQANANYVSSVKQMLQQYASKVNGELGKLPAEIDRDLQIGFKGFVKQIPGDNNGNINLLRETANLRDLSYRFNVFCGRLRMYLEAEIKREHLEQMSQRNPVPRGPETLYTNQLAEIYTALNDLLGHLIRRKRYDHELPGKLDKLTDAVNALRPQGFTKPNSPLLDGIGEGLRAFVGELRNVYISTYDGALDECVLFHAAKKTHTPEAAKCAMILLTITDIIFRGINRLRMGCADGWVHHNINAYNPLGQFLARCGFVVASDGLIHAELRNENACNGAEICGLIHGALEPLDALHDMLKYYLRVCHLHIPPEPRYPCTVRDVLAWLAGLPHTAVYKRVPAHCHNLLRDRNNNSDDVLNHILSTGLHFSLVDTTVLAYDLLVTICGNGRGFDHADYKYACNFWDNSRGFHYPSDVAELLDILASLCIRVLRALNFLRARCRYDASMGHGWSECRYGRNVPAANWQCNDHSNIESNCRPNCQPKTHLQAHLMDQLPGLLPHKLTSVGCDYECPTCPTASPGQQCVTPMGFWDLPRAGSRTGTGRDIFAVLTALCSNAESPLPSLLRCLSSINPCPPQSLGDMFAFFCNLAQCRQSGKYVDNSGFTTNLNANVIPSVSLNLCPRTQAVRLTSALTALYHSPADHAAAAQADADTNTDTNTDTHSDLSSLTVRAQCSDSLTCAPYLQPLSFHACHTFPERHSHLYLSWVVHLAWHFWQLLRELLDQFQNIDCRASGCAECPCNPGQHGVEFNCKCGALVSCGGVMPTLFHHGFTFGNARTLYQTSRKYCRHFHTQLQNVLHSNHFTELFRQIDEFLYCIRLPFLSAIAALWLIAALYILIVLLYRMDVLRIRSHLLTSKASHLIDVKALLTHGRKMLSLYHDVDYFDDEPFD